MGSRALQKLFFELSGGDVQNFLCHTTSVFHTHRYQRNNTVSELYKYSNFSLLPPQWIYTVQSALLFCGLLSVAECYQI